MSEENKIEEQKQEVEEQEVEEQEVEEQENEENENHDNQNEEETQEDGGEEDENLEENDAEEDDENGDDENGDGEKKSSGFYIRLRGLPWKITEQEIIEFLSGVNIANGEKGVSIVKHKTDGKSTGEAYVQLETEKDVEAAFKHDRENMGHRYIEIFKATSEEVDFAMNRIQTGRTVKLRGLPFSVDEEMIEEFFDGLEINKAREGVVIVTDRRGRVTGEAYVQFKTELDAQKALDRNREKIGHRYIEIFRCGLTALKRAVGSRPAPYDRVGNRNAGNRDGGLNRNRRGDDGGFGNNFGGRFNNNGFNNGGGRMNSGGGGFGFNNNSRGNRNNMGGGGGGFGNNFNGGFNNGNNFGGGNFGGNGAYCIHMRGLPYYSYENDINDFFAPVRPMNIEIIYNNRGLHSGTADVYFASADDAIQAMRRHKEQMGARYIELFYDGNTKNGGRI